MKGKLEIIKLADERLEDARCLIVNRQWNGAYYMAGYAIELLLKARVCKTLGLDDLFQVNHPRKNLYRPFKVHNLRDLMLLSGIFPNFVEALQESNFKVHWSTVSEWNENSRYQLEKSGEEAKTFLASILIIATWIKTML